MKTHVQCAKCGKIVNGMFNHICPIDDIITSNDMTSIPAKTYSEQEVEDMLRTLAKKIPCYACDAKCCDDDLHIPCIDRKIEYAKNNPTEETANE